MRWLTDCVSLSMSGRIFSTKVAPSRYFDPCPTRAHGKLASTSPSIAIASRFASSPSTEHPQSWHSMRIHRSPASFLPVTGPQQSTQRPPISTARAGPGVRSPDSRSSKSRQWSKSSFGGIPYFAPNSRLRRSLAARTVSAADAGTRRATFLKFYATLSHARSRAPREPSHVRKVPRPHPSADHRPLCAPRP